MAPPNSSSAPAINSAEEIFPCAARLEILPMFDVPVAKISVKMPNRNGTSPVLVTMNALMPASELTRSSHQWLTRM